MLKVDNMRQNLTSYLDEEVLFKDRYTLLLEEKGVALRLVPNHHKNISKKGLVDEIFENKSLGYETILVFNGDGKTFKRNKEHHYKNFKNLNHYGTQLAKIHILCKEESSFGNSVTYINSKGELESFNLIPAKTTGSRPYVNSRNVYLLEKRENLF